MKTSLNLRAHLLAGAALLATPFAALAEAAPADAPAVVAANDEGSTALSDVLVTATRRETKLQETPIAISLMDNKALEARRVRGPGLDPRDWHVIRGGIDGVVRVTVEDPDDPTPSWVLSTRTPDRLAAAIRRSQAGA